MSAPKAFGDQDISWKLLRCSHRLPPLQILRKLMEIVWNYGCFSSQLPRWFLDFWANLKSILCSKRRSRGLSTTSNRVGKCGILRLGHMLKASNRCKCDCCYSGRCCNCCHGCHMLPPTQFQYRLCKGSEVRPWVEFDVISIQPIHVYLTCWKDGTFTNLTSATKKHGSATNTTTETLDECLDWSNGCWCLDIPQHNHMYSGYIHM